MSATTISDRITVTRHPDGSLTVNGYAPKPLYTDEPDGKTYQSEVFHGYWKDGVALPMWQNADGSYTHLSAWVESDEAEIYLTALAELALRANGGAA